jgi:hypothetical protein
MNFWEKEYLWISFGFRVNINYIKKVISRAVNTKFHKHPSSRSGKDAWRQEWENDLSFKHFNFFTTLRKEHNRSASPLLLNAKLIF